MGERFAVPVVGVELHRTADGGNILFPVRGTLRTTSQKLRKGAEFLAHDTYKIDGFLVDFLGLADGTRTRSGLFSLFSDQYGRLFGPLLAERAWSWMLRTPDLVE